MMQSPNASMTQLVVLDVKGLDCAACPITVKAVLGFPASACK
jgi:hypothetical protein